MSKDYPTKVSAFKAWAKLMEEQATVPDRVQYKGLTQRRVRRATAAKAGKRNFSRRRRWRKGRKRNA